MSIYLELYLAFRCHIYILLQVEGSPALWGLFGFLEWWILAVALLALYVLQVYNYLCGLLFLTIHHTVCR